MNIFILKKITVMKYRKDNLITKQMLLLNLKRIHNVFNVKLSKFCILKFFLISIIIYKLFKLVSYS